jgi:hypothetical protein
MAVPANSHSNNASRWAAVLFLTGCAQIAEPRTYVATIARIEERAGEHYSPTRGARPLHCVYLELEAGDRVRKATLKVLVLDDYSSARYGARGDTVSFRSRQALPVARDLWWDELDGYRVMR